MRVIMCGNQDDLIGDTELFEMFYSWRKVSAMTVCDRPVQIKGGGESQGEILTNETLDK